MSIFPSQNPKPLAEQVVLITGAGGFIGNHIVSLFAERSKSIRALTGRGDLPRVWPSNVMTAQVDVRRADQLASHSAEVDTVVHLAGPPSVRDSFSSAHRYAEVHAGGTANMLQVARQARIRRFVYLSSAEVYGQPLENPVKETHRLQARSPYGAAKIGAERFVESFTQFTGIEAVILRPFSIYGPGQTMKSLLGTILRQIEVQQAISLADLRPVRDYCYVSDLAEAVVSACTVPITNLTTLNIGSGEGTSVADFARLAAEAVGQRLPIAQAEMSDRPDKANIMELVADRRRARDVLGWETNVKLLAGLRNTVRFAQGSASSTSLPASSEDGR